MNNGTFPGHELRARREELGLTTAKASDQIHVSPIILDALEQGRRHDLPAPAYVVGFLKSYCNFLDLDADRYVTLYRESIRPQHRFLGVSRSNADTAGHGGFTALPWVIDLMPWVAGMLLVGLGWVAYAVIVAPAAGINDKQVEASTELYVPQVPDSVSR